MRSVIAIFLRVIRNIVLWKCDAVSTCPPYADGARQFSLAARTRTVFSSFQAFVGSASRSRRSFTSDATLCLHQTAFVHYCFYALCSAALEPTLQVMEDDGGTMRGKQFL